MKNNKSFAVILAVLLIITALPAASAAGTLSGTLNYLARENVVVISGNGAGKPAHAVDILITKGDTAPSASAMPVAFETVRTTADGAYTARIALAPNIQGGIYRVTAASNGQFWHDVFVAVDESAAAPVLSKINSAASAVEVKEALNAAFENFGLFAEEYAYANVLISQIVFGRRPPDGYENAAAVSALAKEAVAIEQILALDGSLTEILREQSALLEIDCAAYEALNSGEQSIFAELLRAADCTNQNFAAVYGDILRLTKIRGASNWQAMKAQTLLYAKEFQLEMDAGSLFAGVRNQDEVFQLMYKKDLSTYAKVKAAFDEAVREAVKNQKGSSGGNGGGTSSVGGGGGRQSSGLGNWTIDPEAEQALTEQTAFFDIAGHWAKDDIQSLAEKGLIAGYGDGTFRPNQNITRAEFIKMVAEAFSLKGTDAPAYADVARGDWFYPYLQSASALVRGYDGHFYPESCITRQDAAVILYRLLDEKQAALTDRTTFADDGEIAEYARDAVGALAAAGLLKGRGDGFAPREQLTRAEMVRLVVTISDYLDK